MNIMNTEWIEIEDMFKVREYSETWKKNYRGVLRNLKAKYPTGDNWLKTPIEEKEHIIIWRNYNDSRYILSWALERGLMDHPEYRKAIIDYYSKFYNSVGGICKELAQYYKFVTEEEAEALEALRKKGSEKVVFVNSFYKLCVTFGKKLKDLTEKEIRESCVDWSLNTVVTSRNTIQKAMFALGYTTKKQIVYRYIKEKPPLEKMVTEYPHLETPIRDYHKYMIAGKYSKVTIERKLGNLSNFLKFLNERSDTINLSKFQGIDFWAYYNWLSLQFGTSYTYAHVLDAKLFIEWGLNEYPDLPKTIDYPEGLSSKLSRALIAEQENSEGRAFPIEGLAQRIIQECYAYVPETEREALCRDFWLIIGSCPVRFSFVHNLELDCLKPMLNSDSFLGLTSTYRDKAGNVNAQFPLFDCVGIEAIHRLQKRFHEKGFEAITNPSNKQKYYHLFHENKVNGLLPSSAFRGFLKDRILPRIKEIEDYKIKNDGYMFEIGAHGFRHFIATVVQAKTRNIKATQFILGHHDDKMTMRYLRSKISRNTLLYSIVDGYEKQEISGKFYLKIIEMWNDESIEDSRLFDVFMSDMDLTTFLKHYGRKRDMGWCMSEDHCETYYRCWGCNFFVMRREEIEEAIELLAALFREHRNLVQNSKDYISNNPIAASSIKTQVLIQKRLTDLSISPEMIWEMVRLKLLGKDIKEALSNGNFSLPSKE
ncbi:hypothetical protein LHV56_12085 [Peribacillus frigoritolerans]|uniref:hypothetical protein n=1 Tax=Peribacillus frigoritolerans TaxID=450367 RepID=UPI00207A31B1|nr:hypothetical protein [Peribacillus frigoritolerans]USK82572.1 hypothetical protein LHV56_12085 [Peribacillus frigoritolerans]